MRVISRPAHLMAWPQTPLRRRPSPGRAWLPFASTISAEMVLMEEVAAMDLPMLSVSFQICVVAEVGQFNNQGEIAYFIFYGVDYFFYARERRSREGWRCLRWGSLD